MKCFVYLTMMPFILHGQSDLETVFTSIYHNHAWGGGKETVSGSGSMMVQTMEIRKMLPQLLKDLNIKTLLDAPCGDFNWMKTIDLSMLDMYIGIDIVKDLIIKNKNLYEKNNILFLHKDISFDSLPDSDLILCRDLFLHISFNDILNVLANFKKTKAKYLLVSTFAKQTVNIDCQKVDNNYRPINLELPPFNFQKPLLLINDFLPTGKYMGLWKLDSLSI